MNKISLLFWFLLISIATPVVASSNHSATNKANRSDSIYASVRQLYTEGKVSADSVVNLALYHKGWSPELTERCLKLVTDHNSRGMMELGVLYAFSPEYARHATEGVKLLQHAANAGNNEANCYLGFYYFTHKDYKKAKACFDACQPMKDGFGYAALGSMYTTGNGVPEDLTKARENYHQSALKGYPRGMALYGFNLRAGAAGPINYPDSFFWLYISGDLGDDAARTTLFLPRRGENRGESETAMKAQEALQWIELAQSGKKIQNQPIYKEGFLPGLKNREKSAERGDDWSRFYLGSMNYNGDFLNQNYGQALRYYEAIAQNDRLPHNVLAVVHARLAEMYRDGKGIKADHAKAEYHLRKAAGYGSLTSYIIVENIAE